MQKGQITVFFSLVLAVIISMLGAVIEMSRIQVTKTYIRAAADMGVDSVFAEYHTDMLEVFDLFFIDGSYKSKRFSEEFPAGRLEEYIAYNIAANEGSGYTDLWRTRLEAVEMQQMVLATDNKGEVFRFQAADYMAGNMGVQALRELLARTSSYEEAEKGTQQYEITSQDNETELHAAADIIREEGLEQEFSDQDNPIEQIAELKTLSILHIAVKDPGMLSNRAKDLSSAPSSRQLQQGYGSYEKQEDYSDRIEQVLFHEYLLDKMGHVCNGRETGSLLYEVEYILMGQASDIENLEAVVNKLLLIREGINFAYLLSDTAKRNEALTLAAGLVGAVPVPGLVSVVQTAILLAWAYGESIVEMRTLIDGGRIPYVKTADNWTLQLSNLASLTEEVKPEAENGMAYEDFLRLLLYLTDEETVTMRAMDIVEDRIHQTHGNESFKIDRCIYKIEFITEWKIGAVFSSLAAFWGRQEEIYRWQLSQAFQY